MSDQPMYFNGINAETGAYVLPPRTPAQIANLARGLPPDINQKELKWRRDRATQGHYGLKDGLDPKRLEESGWGIIFAADADPAIEEALSELIQFRCAQTREDIFKIYKGEHGYRPGESKPAFLARHGAGPGPANPVKVPYYLLIAGDPQSIPYSFQIQLDVQYAVGRVYFETLDEYAQYAHSVVEAEKRSLALSRAAAFFGVANADDPATNLSASQLVSPLAQYFSGDQPGWKVQAITGEDAKKNRLGQFLGGPETPALLFTASHGLAFPYNPQDASQQLAYNGALLCGDWPGPKNWHGKLSPDHYFSAEDLDPNGNLLGLIAFHFACFGAGTPHLDEFAKTDFRDREPIAPYAFVSRLPQKMLAHPRGGALAVIGHVDRAWSYSFNWGRAGEQLAVFEASLKRLLEGHPVGSAFERFNERYAELASDLSVILENQSFGQPIDEYELAGMWTANNDARNYVVLGDPAVRLMVEMDSGNGTTKGRESIEIQSVHAPPSEETTGPTPAAPPAPSPTVGQPPQGSIVDYGLLDSLRQAGQGAGTGIKDFLDHLGSFLATALEDAAVLEVASYASDRMENVKYENGQFTGARLRALTRIKIDGDTLVCVPEEDGEVDLDLWKIHLEMLQQAQTSRAELLRTIVSAATSLGSLLKP